MRLETSRKYSETGTKNPVTGSVLSYTTSMNGRNTLVAVKSGTDFLVWTGMSTGLYAFYPKCAQKFLYLFWDRDSVEGNASQLRRALFISICHTVFSLLKYDRNPVSRSAEQLIPLGNLPFWLDNSFKPTHTATYAQSSREVNFCNFSN